MKWPKDLDRAYGHVEEWLNDDVPSRLVTVTSADELAYHLNRHRKLTRVASVVDSEICEPLIPLIPFGGKVFPGIGTLEVKGGKKNTRYRNEDLISKLAAGIADSIRQGAAEHGGEMPSTDEIIEAAVTTTAQACGALAPSFSSWRSTVLRRFGVDPGAYAYESEPTPKTILIR